MTAHELARRLLAGPDIGVLLTQGVTEDANPLAQVWMQDFSSYHDHTSTRHAAIVLCPEITPVRLRGEPQQPKVDLLEGYLTHPAGTKVRVKSHADSRYHGKLGVVVKASAVIAEPKDYAGRKVAVRFSRRAMADGGPSNKSCVAHILICVDDLAVRT